MKSDNQKLIVVFLVFILMLLTLSFIHDQVYDLLPGYEDHQVATDDNDDLIENALN